MIIFEFNSLLKASLVYALLSVTAATMNTYIKKERQVIISILAGLILAGLTLFSFPAWCRCAIVGVLLFSVVLVTVNPKSVRKALWIFLVAGAYTLLKWGVSYFIQIVIFSFCPFNMSTLFLFYVFDYLLTIFASFVIVVCFRVSFKKKLILDFVYDSVIQIGEKKIKLKLLLDSGNSLVDPQTGLPVIVVSKNSLEEKLDAKINLGALRELKYQTIGGYNGNLFTFIPDSIWIFKEKGNKDIKAVFGIVEREFKLYDGLLNLATI